jgi:hypothetical protein
MDEPVAIIRVPEIIVSHFRMGFCFLDRAAGLAYDSSSKLEGYRYYFPSH